MVRLKRLNEVNDVTRRLSPARKVLVCCGVSLVIDIICVENKPFPCFLDKKYIRVLFVPAPSLASVPILLNRYGYVSLGES